MSTKRNRGGGGRAKNRDQSRVFSRLPDADVAKLLSTAQKIADANGCTLLGANTTMKHVTLGKRTQAVVCNLKGEQISPTFDNNDFGGTKIMFPAAAYDMFTGVDSVFRDGVVTGKGDKETVYLSKIPGDANSAAANEQFLDLYRHKDNSDKAWPHAVGLCAEHAVEQTMKGKGGKRDPVKIAAKAQEKVDQSAVFYPIGLRGDDTQPKAKLSHKVVKKGEFDAEHFKGTGFDCDAVKAYFETQGQGTTLSLIEFLGRDGSKWEGRPENIKQIHAGFFIVTLYPCYYAAIPKKFTFPHRLHTVVCLSCDIDNGSGASTFSMPDLQKFAGLPASPPPEADDGGDTDDDGDATDDQGVGDVYDDEGTDEVGDADAEFASQRKRAKRAGSSA